MRHEGDPDAPVHELLPNVADNRTFPERVMSDIADLKTAVAFLTVDSDTENIDLDVLAACRSIGQLANRVAALETSEARRHSSETRTQRWFNDARVEQGGVL